MWRLEAALCQTCKDKEAKRNRDDMIESEKDIHNMTLRKSKEALRNKHLWRGSKDRGK